ncbi:MAG: hypothetical protein RLP12_12070 [Ekhidna sp.]
MPNGETAMLILEGNEMLWEDVERKAKKNLIIELDKPSIYITVYHKVGWKVLKKETIRTSESRIKIKRREDATSSTVIWEGGSLEIVWKE